MISFHCPSMAYKIQKYILQVMINPILVSLPTLIEVDDIVAADPTAPVSASPIVSINGQDVTDFLSQIAVLNSVGNIEPNADWNDLMSSYAANIQNEYSIFESSITFYPGDIITIELENGTQLDPLPWIAIYNSPGPTGPLLSGGDFYNFFVLGLYPESYNDSAPDPCASSDTAGDSSGSNSDSGLSSSSDSNSDSGSDSNSDSNSDSSSGSSSSDNIPTSTSWPDTAYPSTADIYQPSLYPSGGGFLTGYYLRSIFTAVLSIPTFQMLGDDIQTFSDTVGNFLNSSHTNGMTKIVIDLQQNLGGDELLAMDTFKHVESTLSIPPG